MSDIKERYSVDEEDGKWQVWYTPTWELVGTYGTLEEAWRTAECDDADRGSMAADLAIDDLDFLASHIQIIPITFEKG